MKEKAYNLEVRLIAFAVSIIRIGEVLPKTPIGNHVRGQILRSGTSPAPNYGEAQSAESRTDFSHKLKIVLTELRETNVWLLIIPQARLVQPSTALEALLQETNELIAIFVTMAKNTKTTYETPQAS